MNDCPRQNPAYGRLSLSPCICVKKKPSMAFVLTSLFERRSRASLRSAALGRPVRQRGFQIAPIFAGQRPSKKAVHPCTARGLLRMAVVPCIACGLLRMVVHLWILGGLSKKAVHPCTARGLPRMAKHPLPRGLSWMAVVPCTVRGLSKTRVSRLTVTG
jgi:hypothetical protein